MKAIPFRTQLTLLHGAVITVVMALGAAAAHWALSRSVHEQLDAALLALAETESAMLASAPDQPIHIHEAAPGPAPPAFVRLDRLVQIIGSDGTVLARSANLGSAQLPVSPQTLQRLRSGETVFETLPEFGGEPTRVVTLPVPAHGAFVAIQVAGSLDDANRVTSSAGLLFIALALVLLATVGIAGALLTRRVFRAVDEVVRQARSIGDGNLDERLPHPGTRDEIGALVETLNEMLARLQHGFEAQRHFTADASHELRSPLSRLRAELEVTLRRPRSVEEYVETLRSCLGEVERLTQLSDELLLLARLDASQERGPSEAVELNALAEEVLGRIRHNASSRQVWLALDPAPPILAKIAPAHISLVLTNLLDNAVKFSPPGGLVTLDLASTGGEAVLKVSDDGPGIDPEDLPQLFERFYRGASARTRETPGAGLGLALSQAIVRAYGGKIDAANLPQGGAVFTVRLPLAQAEAA
jgi:two-component system OmpR family sensor kinase